MNAMHGQSTKIYIVQTLKTKVKMKVQSSTGSYWIHRTGKLKCVNVEELKVRKARSGRSLSRVDRELGFRIVCPYSIAIQEPS